MYRGMARFREARVQESLQDFDRVMEIEPRYGDILWQRGLALYYLDRYDEVCLCATFLENECSHLI